MVKNDYVKPTLGMDQVATPVGIQFQPQFLPIKLNRSLKSYICIFVDVLLQSIMKAIVYFAKINKGHAEHLLTLSSFWLVKLAARIF